LIFTDFWLVLHTQNRSDLLMVFGSTIADVDVSLILQKLWKHYITGSSVFLPLFKVCVHALHVFVFTCNTACHTVQLLFDFFWI